MKIIKQE